MKLLKAFLGFALLMVSGSAVAQIFPGFEFEEEVDARNADQNINLVAGFNTTKWGIGILASNGHTANVDVAGTVSSSKFGAYVAAGDIDTNPQTPGVATLTVEGLVGNSIQGFNVEPQLAGSVATLICNGNVTSSNGRGGIISSSNGGIGNVAVDGNIVGSYRGLDFDLSGGTADVLVTGTISGGSSIGINYSARNNTTLTVWKLQATNNSYIADLGYVGEDNIETFAKDKINYIIKHADNITPLTATGDPLPKSHGYSVAKEGDRVTIQLNGLGVYIKKAFNNGVEITEKDKNDRFYVTVARGGGINLTVETAPVLACDDVESQIGKACNNGIAGTCFMSGTYECNPATGKVECKLVDDVDGRIEICGNNDDDDCDGTVDEADCIDVPDLDSDGDGVPDSEDVCPNDPLNGLVMPVGGCFVNGSNIPERYDPKVPTDVVATPKTKLLPAFVLHNRSSVDVYFERFGSGAFKELDKAGKAKYQVMIKTKNKKGLTKKTVMQALSKNSRKFKPGKGVTITVQYRVAITKKVGKKNVTKRSKWSKAVKFQKMQLD